MIISAPKRNSKILSKRKSELNKVKVKEAEIVEYYLNRLRKEISESEGFRSLREALQEREDLKLQLEELKANPTTGKNTPSRMTLTMTRSVAS